MNVIQNINLEQSDIDSYNIIYKICTETYEDFKDFKHIGIDNCLFVGLYQGLYSKHNLKTFTNVISLCECCPRHLHICSHNMNLDRTCACTCRRFMRRALYAIILYDKFLRTGEFSCLLNSTMEYLYYNNDINNNDIHNHDIIKLKNNNE
jgi:hypothetical protein